MRIILFLLGYIFFGALNVHSRNFVVIDSTDNGPVAGATVIDRSGIIKGLTDELGHFNVSTAELPVTIRCIGYEPVVSSPADTIVMTPTPFSLNEVTVNPVDRPIKRVICFAREYTTGVTGPDTMIYYCEYMAQAFIVAGKVKGYRSYDAEPRIKSAVRYGRIVSDGRDSVFRPKRSDDIAFLSWFDVMATIPHEKITVPDAIRNGADADTVKGKLGMSIIMRKKNRLFTCTFDMLAGRKDHSWSPFLFKLIGLTTDITTMIDTWSFTANKADVYGINDFRSGIYNLHVLARGKWFKKIFHTKEAIEMDAYLDLYPVEITNLTVDEYKELRSDRTPLPFKYPDNLQPLSPYVGQLVDRINALQKD